MKKNLKTGSYLVEAAVIMPIFILSVVMLMSGIRVLSTVESVIFSVADEMRLESVKSAIRQNEYVLPAKTGGRVYAETEDIYTFHIVNYRYLYTKETIQDLITLHGKISCKGNDLFHLFDDISFEGKITTRAFTGAIHKNAPYRTSEHSNLVYIFPEWGNRYHHKNCTFIKENCQMLYLSQKTKKNYEPCKLCDAKSAQIDSPVFCFLTYGKVYHLSSCKTVERYYIEIEQGKAELQGYTPCFKCGGGKYESKT